MGGRAEGDLAAGADVGAARMAPQRWVRAAARLWLLPARWWLVAKSLGNVACLCFLVLRLMLASIRRLPVSPVQQCCHVLTATHARLALPVQGRLGFCRVPALCKHRLWLRLGQSGRGVCDQRARIGGAGSSTTGAPCPSGRCGWGLAQRTSAMPYSGLAWACLVCLGCSSQCTLPLRH